MTPETKKLFNAAKTGNVADARAALAAGADVNAKDDEWQQKPLHWAAVNGHFDIVKMLEAAAKQQQGHAAKKGVIKGDIEVRDHVEVDDMVKNPTGQNKGHAARVPEATAASARSSKRTQPVTEDSMTAANESQPRTLVYRWRNVLVREPLLHRVGERLAQVIHRTNELEGRDQISTKTAEHVYQGAANVLTCLDLPNAIAYPAVCEVAANVAIAAIEERLRAHLAANPYDAGSYLASVLRRTSHLGE